MNRCVFCFFILLGFCFFPFSVVAEECKNPIAIESISLIDYSGEIVERDNASIDKQTITLNLNVFDKGDTAIYKIILNNTNDEDYSLSNDKMTYRTDYLDYQFYFDNDSLVIPAKKKRELFLKVTYQNIPTSTQFQNNGRILTDEKISLPLSSNSLSNPKTGFSLFLLFLGVILASLFVFGFLLLYHTYYGSYSFILILLFIPLVVQAACSSSVNIQSNIMIENPKYAYTNRNIENYLDNQINGEYYTDYQEALNYFDEDYYLRHLLDQDNNIIKSEVGFVYKGKTYYLNGGKSQYFEQNKKILISAFGSSNCSDLNTNFLCSDDTYSATVGDDGYVEFGNNYSTCSVDSSGLSLCMTW